MDVQGPDDSRHQVIAEQQKIADAFRDLALILAAIDVADAVRKPCPDAWLRRPRGQSRARSALLIHDAE
jgi:hypothetical protein